MKFNLSLKVITQGEYRYKKLNLHYMLFGCKIKSIGNFKIFCNDLFYNTNIGLRDTVIF